MKKIRQFLEGWLMGLVITGSVLYSLIVVSTYCIIVLGIAYLIMSIINLNK